jgi:hypothetical protein
MDAVHRLLGPTVGYTVLSEQTVNVQHSLHLQAVALSLMAAFTGLASTLILSQLLIRQAVEDGDDNATLRALGMTSGQLFVSNMVRVAATGITGAAGAVALAALMSPLLPLGTARIAEPHPGFVFDAAVLLIGGAVSVRAIKAREQQGEGPRLAGPSTLGDLLARPGLPLVATTGIRLAVQPGRGRNALPVRATITAVTIGATDDSMDRGRASLAFGHRGRQPHRRGAGIDGRPDSAGHRPQIRVSHPAPARRAGDFP